MTQKEFVKAVAADASKKLQTKVTEHVVGEVVKSSITIASETLAKGDQLQFAGFGTFCTTEKPAREGRNPATGATMHIPAKIIPKFKPGKTLKEAVNATSTGKKKK